MPFRHQTMWLTVLHAASVQAQVSVLRQEGKDHLTGQQRHLTAKSVYYHLFQILKSQYIFHVIRNCLASLSGENKFKGITVHPAQNNTKIDCSVYEKVFMMFTEEKQLSSCTTQGFSVINVNGSDPPTQCTVTTIEIYKSMSKECLISVLLNKQAGGADKASVRSSSSTSREDPYLWHVAMASPGYHCYFWCGRVTGSSSLAADNRRGRASCHTCACTHTFPTSPTRTIKAEGIDRNDWLKWKSFVKTSCHWNNTEMMCAVLFGQALFGQRLFKRKVLLC